MGAFEIAVTAIAVGVVMQVLYWHNGFINSVLEDRQAQYDDSNCQPGFTKCPPPM